MSKDNTDLPKIRKSSQKIFLITFVLVLLGILGIGGSISAYNAQPQVRIQKALEAGEKYLAELDYEKAVAHFNEVIVIEPNEVMAYRGLVRAYAEQGNYEEALEQYGKAVAQIPEENIGEMKSDILEYLWEGGMQAVVVEDYNTAIYCYEEILEIDIDDSDTQEIFVEAKSDLCYVYLTLADKAKAEGKYEESITYCNKVVEISPEHTEVPGRLCELYLILADKAKEEGKYDNAISYCNKVLEIEGENAEATEKLCELYLALAQIAEEDRDYNKAAQCYNSALTFNSENQVALDGKLRMEERAKVDEYEPTLRAMMQTIAAGEYYDFSYTSIITGEFNDFIKNTLSHPVIYEMEDGLYMGVYPKGYIYYGEMDNGVRSGKGYWCIGGIYQFSVLYINWINDVPNGEAVIEIYTNEDKIPMLGDNHFYCLYYMEKVNLVNGVYEGASTIKQIYDHDDPDIGFYNPHEFELTYSNGVRVPIDGTIVAYCKNCTKRTFMSEIYASNHVYKIEY